MPVETQVLVIQGEVSLETFINRPVNLVAIHYAITPEGNNRYTVLYRD